MSLELLSGTQIRRGPVSTEPFAVSELRFGSGTVSWSLESLVECSSLGIVCVVCLCDLHGFRCFSCVSISCSFTFC